MRGIAIDARRGARSRAPARGRALTRGTSRSWVQRVVFAAWAAAALALFAGSEAAAAVTLKLTFSDGQPMTYGSACSGEGCLLRGAGIETTDAGGQVLLAALPDGIVEYRRDGIELSPVTPAGAAGRVHAAGERATVVLPRLLLATAPAVDGVEADLVSRIDEERGARGLAPAQLDARLSAAADLQATWLSSGASAFGLPLLSHLGPFGSTMAFRLGAVSFPEPSFGAEIAAAGATPAQALGSWMASAPHRDQVLAPGAPLIGVGAVGSVIIVTSHPPCAGCHSAAPVSIAGAAPAAPGGTSDSAARGGTSAARGTAPAPAGTSSVSGSSGGRASSCGAEQLRVRRLRDRNRRVRVSVRVRCLRRGASYRLSVIQRPSRSVLTTRRIARAGTIRLALRPARTTRALGVKLKRNGRVVAARSVSRWPAEPG